jgi:hypothetical protein
VLAVFATLEPCLIGREACAGAQVRARELTAPGHGGAADAGRRREALP